ncbi:hypothetical protein FYJ24_07430 [Actinomycetaceae bacterium WB03_NA08]|uniref:Uncharacterized protein n=1 Tax=Scrofimicrobium canadense TaxID=2652290 RepID=A0A6N7W8K2_9ACTO|nr:hypothetical protein [Scrofimicrobium canadense]MSS84596.1 hypothetical protein [Scrofimicrobium canadense]
MEKIEWLQLEGMIIAVDLDPEAVSAYVAKTGVIAELEWYPQTPNMMGITVATDGEALASWKNKTDGVVPGPTLISFVEDLAGQLNAEVMIGDMGVDRLPEDAQPAERSDSEETGPMRVVEISSTPASAVPLMAAFEGVDVADLELAGQKRALMAELPVERSGWYLGDVPLVTLTYHDGEFQAFLVEDEDPENVVTFNWAMEQKLVPGAASLSDADAVAMAEELVGSRSTVLRIHDGVPGVSGDAAWESASASGSAAVHQFVAALGLPDSVADYLLGNKTLSDIEGASVHEARGVSNAIGRSMNIMLDQKESDSEVWERYSQRVSERPWQVPVTSGIEAAVGTALIVLGRGRGRPRNWLGRLGTVAGVLLMVDAVGELALAKYVRARNQRRDLKLSQLQTPGISD